MKMLKRIGFSGILTNDSDTIFNCFNRSEVYEGKNFSKSIKMNALKSRKNGWEHSNFGSCIE